jgi:Holliday junction resolvasome RuvABC endonuclease subunit
MQYVGVDPGSSSGGIAILDMETNEVGLIKLANTEHDIWEWLNQVIKPLSSAVTIEDVHSMPDQSAQSGFTFGRSYGFLIGIFTALQIPMHFVTPQKWQKAMQCRTGGDKNISKSAAQRLWPELKITHAYADALLIAEYGRLHVWQ